MSVFVFSHPSQYSLVSAHCSDIHPPLTAPPNPTLQKAVTQPQIVAENAIITKLRHVLDTRH